MARKRRVLRTHRPSTHIRKSFPTKVTTFNPYKGTFKTTYHKGSIEN